MKLSLPRPPGHYSASDFTTILRTIERAFSQVVGRNEDIIHDSGRGIHRAPDGAYWQVSVDNGGNLTTTNLGTSL